MDKKYIICIGLSLVLGLSLIYFQILTLLFILPSFLGIILFRKIKALLIITILYILIFYILTTLLWFEYLNLDIILKNAEFMLYNPLLACLLSGIFLYIALNLKNFFFKIKIKSKNNRLIKVILKQLLFLLFFLLINILYIYIKGGHPAIDLYLNTFFIPIAVFIAVIIAVVNKDLKKSDIIDILRIIVALSLLLASFGIFEFIKKENILYKFLQTKNSLIWHAPYYITRNETPYRIFSFMGHPLGSAFLFMIAALYSLILKKRRLIYLGIFLIANILTFTRTTIILVPLLLLSFLILKKEIVIVKKQLLIFVILLIGIGIYLSPLKKEIETRFILGKASTEIRTSALEYASNSLYGNISNYLFGKGAGKSREVSESFIKKKISFEIPWIMMAIDNGIIVTFIYMSILFYILLVLFKSIRRKDTFSIISFLVPLGGIVQLSSYNAINSYGQMSLFLWLIISLSLGYKFAKYDSFPNYYEKNLKTKLKVLD